MNLDLDKCIYVHGFLGEFDEINQIEGLDLYSLIALSDNEIIEHLEDKYSQKSIVFGYSLGGRFILRYYERFFSRFEKVYLISTNFGSYDLNERVKFETNVISKLKNNNFLDYWNNLEIFRYCHPLKVLRRDSSDYQRLFKRWKLSDQQDYSFLLRSAKNIKIILGELDHKYMSLYKDFNNKIVLENLGHRINTLNKFERIYELDN